ncbi:MAG TPA: TolC family protein [Pirellulales bacterium]|nr:TolC family protein [Pirellulales bacterium]
MFRRRLLLLAGLLLVTGCTWPVRQRTNQTVCRLANQPYDVRPDNNAQISQAPTEGTLAGGASRGAQKPTTSATSGIAAQPAPTTPARAVEVERKQLGSATGQQNELRFSDARPASTDLPLDAGAETWLEPPVGLPAAAKTDGGVRNASGGSPGTVRPAAWSQPALGDSRIDVRLPLSIPDRLPGSETPAVNVPDERAALAHAIEGIYPALPPLPVEPRMAPGPNGRPYTLTELQRIAAANSPPLRQAVADVQAAQGRLVQARTYVNPNGTYFVDPTNNNATTGVQGIGVEQLIKTGGKQKLAAAAVQKDLENAELALRRARNNLATQVRQAYFALLVDKETLAVTRAVAKFTDDIYQLQAQLAKGSGVAGYEPASLRAQAFTTRLAYQQAIATYIYDWKALVAAIGVRQMPLTQVAGRIDQFIPYYDYDQALAHILRNHTDILTARNMVPQAKYNLKAAQVAVIPDLDISYKYARDFTVAPFGTYQQFQIQMPLAVWDRNKGNIIAAQAALVRATEQQHNTELDLTNQLADAYTTYQNNLYAIEYYRSYILPDLVRYYRGVYARRPVDSENINVGDLAFAQQSLSQNVTAYLGVLGSLWQSVVAVADLLQTDDLFQMATPRTLPDLPNFDELGRWACGHDHLAASCGVPNGLPARQPIARPNSPPAPNVRPTASTGPRNRDEATIRPVATPPRSAAAAKASDRATEDR